MDDVPRSDRRFELVRSSIIRLATGKGITIERIDGPLVNALGLSTPEEAYNAIHSALKQLPQDKHTEALRCGLGGNNFSDQVTKRREPLTERYRVTDQAVKVWASKAAERMARLLLSPEAPPPVQEPEDPVVFLPASILEVLDRQTEILQEIKDRLEK